MLFVKDPVQDVEASSSDAAVCTLKNILLLTLTHDLKLII